ncbi:MAG TPA: hypothetical protein VJ044_20660 [Candidatus Hodarchaeales archaeon]|nr:hypothetical protein [Candidatus Hodarchaeales archaeon]
MDKYLRRSPSRGWVLRLPPPLLNKRCIKCPTLRSFALIANSHFPSLNANKPSSIQRGLSPPSAASLAGVYANNKKNNPRELKMSRLERIKNSISLLEKSESPVSENIFYRDFIYLYNIAISASIVYDVAGNQGMYDKEFQDLKDKLEA